MLETQGKEALFELLRSIARRLGAFDKHEASCCGVTTAQCRTIFELGCRGEASSIVDLAGQLGVDKSAASRTVDLLVKEGLAQRQEGRENRRYVSIRLTQRGKTVYAARKKNMDEYLSDVLDEIPAEKRAQVEESIRLLAAAIGRVKCC